MHKKISQGKFSWDLCKYEPLEYTNWHQGEPNDKGGEPILKYDQKSSEK